METEGERRGWSASTDGKRILSNLEERECVELGSAVIW
jgi:hypothetical protein